jgi:soluble lytic murein transglycosylase-like protein
MRILVLVLNIVVGASLSIYSTDMLAAAGHKTHKGGHKSRSKGKRHHGHHKAVVRDPGNVWDRIRAGMRIPKPTPPQAFSSQGHSTAISKLPIPNQANVEQYDAKEKIDAALESKYTRLGVHHQLLSRSHIVSPNIATTPLQNYTRYGRQRLNASPSELGDTNATIAQALQNRQGRLLHPSPDYLTPGARVRTRIRTQLAPPSSSSLNRTPSISSEIIANRSEPAMASTSNLSPQSAENNTKSLPLPHASDTLTKKQPGLIDKQSTREEEIWRQQATIYGRVKKQINSYAQRPDYLQRVAERSRPYLYHIVEELGRHDMPMELALLPIVESAFQATALSPMNAAGIWQFIPSTGHDFNLAQDANYDARLDVTASTRAAVRFLYGLKSHFGDWLLALAAYNCGQGTVDAAINANRTAGLGTDYWSLNLPAETMDYVPRLLAVAQIFANPGVYGLRLNPNRNEPYFVKVKIDRRAHMDYLAGKDISTVAQMAGLSYGQFCRLNPGYIQSKLSTNGPFTFLMPGSHASKLRDSLDSIAKFLGQATQLSKNAPVKAESTKEAGQAAIPSIISAASPAMPIKPPTIASPFVSLDLGSQNKTATEALNNLATPIKNN